MCAFIQKDLFNFNATFFLPVESIKIKSYMCKYIYIYLCYACSMFDTDNGIRIIYPSQLTTHK